MPLLACGCTVSGWYKADVHCLPELCRVRYCANWRHALAGEPPVDLATDELVRTVATEESTARTGRDSCWTIARRDLLVRGSTPQTCTAVLHLVGRMPPRQGRLPPPGRQCRSDPWAAGLARSTCDEGERSDRRSGWARRR